MATAIRAGIWGLTRKVEESLRRPGDVFSSARLTNAVRTSEITDATNYELGATR
jgi:hypothetical protein